MFTWSLFTWVEPPLKMTKKYLWLIRVTVGHAAYRWYVQPYVYQPINAFCRDVTQVLQVWFTAVLVLYYSKRVVLLVDKQDLRTLLLKMPNIIVVILCLAIIYLLHHLWRKNDRNRLSITLNGVEQGNSGTWKTFSSFIFMNSDIFNPFFVGLRHF
jgi:hypothetical protein